jgi:hypothetical protein
MTETESLSDPPGSVDDPGSVAESEPSPLSRLARGVTALSVFSLALVVLGVGVVAFLAELAKTWSWYFRMEQAMALAAPVTLALLAVAVVGGLGVVLTNGRG